MRARRLARQSRGVAAVIGTLLGLLVFMTLFGIFITQFLPIWMTDNEAALANTIEAQLANIQGCMGQLALVGRAGAFCSEPISTISASVPVFAQPTQASVSFSVLSSLYTNISFNLSAVGASTAHGNFWQNVTPNSLFVNLPDRYYVPLTYQLSDGALLDSQGGNVQSLLFAPAIVASSSGQSTSLTMTVFEMFGNASSAPSTGTTEVYVSYLASTVYSQTSSTAVNMTVETYYPCAWQQFWNGAFTGSSVTPLFRPANCPSNVRPNQLFTEKAYFPPVSSFTLNVVEFSFAVGTTNP